MHSNTPTEESRHRTADEPRLEAASNGVKEVQTQHLAADPAVAEALVHALNRETTSHLGDDTYEDLGYQAYVSQLIYLLENIANDSSNAEAYRALVYSAWNGDSQLERWLSKRPGSIKPALDLLATKEPGWRGDAHRSQAVYLLADLLRTFRQEVCILPPEKQTAWVNFHPDTTMHMLRYEALRGKDGMRDNAIEGLALVGSQDDLKLLRAIGRSNRQLQFFTKIAIKQITDGKTASKCAAPVPQ